MAVLKPQIADGMGTQEDRSIGDPISLGIVLVHSLRSPHLFCFLFPHPSRFRIVY